MVLLLLEQLNAGSDDRRANAGHMQCGDVGGMVIGGSIVPWQTKSHVPKQAAWMEPYRLRLISGQPTMPKQ